MATPPGKLEQLAVQLKELSETLAREEASQLAAPRAKRVRKTISEAYDKLRKVMEDLDPDQASGLRLRSLESERRRAHRWHHDDRATPQAARECRALLRLRRVRDLLQRRFPAYTAISKREHPIYVGKADPADPASKTAMEQGDRLSGRLNEHRKNIAKATTTLRLEDFEYRALVVQTGWQTAAENYLIDLFKPIWNNEVGHLLRLRQAWRRSENPRQSALALGHVASWPRLGSPRSQHEGRAADGADHRGHRAASREVSAASARSTRFCGASWRKCGPYPDPGLRGTAWTRKSEPDGSTSGCS